MALTLIKRPLGHKLNSTDVEAQIIDDGQGDVLVYTSVAHGLSDGDYIYISSNLDSYNGFFYVDSIAYDSFKIRPSETGDYVEFVQDADISYRTSVLQHGWQAVHNLIVYELESDLWPNNIAEEAYIPVAIVSQADENGNTLLNLDVGLSPLPTVLNFIELVGDSALAGPYQILQVDNPWAIVINLAYDAANDFSGLQVVNYYNNYAINVEVWAGLSSDHRWVAKKPYELAATLKFIPDAEGKIKFSIADILKGYITTRNNLTLDTLPNNLDFHVSFYIKYYESYDDSDGETITTFEGEVTTDSFEGHATNSMMPFKSLNSGHMSDYINEGSFLAQWLTLMDRPMLFANRFFDISFILQYNGFDVVVTIYKSLEDVVTDTDTITITNPGQGIIRVPIDVETGFDQYCIQAAIDGTANISLPLLDSGENLGSGTDWVIDSSPEATLPGSFVGTAETKEAAYDFDFIDGITYLFTFNSTRVGATVNLRFRVLDGDGNVISTDNNSVGVGTSDSTASVTGEAGMKKYSFSFLYASGGADPDLTVTINSISATITADNLNITEQICCDVVDECSPTFVNDLLRLTEAAQLRELE